MAYVVSMLMLICFLAFRFWKIHLRKILANFYLRLEFNLLMKTEKSLQVELTNIKSSVT